ncbi:Mobile element protein, partial [Bathymodiolus azoricus thioautotrophic gill symbiont]
MGLIDGYLGSTVFSDDGRNRIITCVRKAAYTMSDPADLVNVAIEELSNANIELPAFSTLDRLVSHERQAVHNELYLKITTDLTSNHRQSLEALLQITEGDQLTGFAQMKQTPGPATLKHFRAWEDRLAQLKAVLDPKPFFKEVAYTKIRQFAAEAQAYEISDMRGIRNDAKRYTLLLSLLHITQSKTRDELIDMFLKRMKRVQHTAQEKLRDLQEKHREMEESLIGVLGQVLQHANGDDANAVLGKHVRETLNDQGGIEILNDQFTLVTAYHHNNYLPLLWSAHATNRAVIFRVLDLIQIKASTQDRNLLQALEFVCQHRNTRKDSLPPDINIGFISQRWETF